MANQKLLDYIKQQLTKGTDRKIIAGILMDNGWSDEEIMESFNSAISQNRESALKRQNQKPISADEENEILKKSYVFSPSGRPEKTLDGGENVEETQNPKTNTKINTKINVWAIILTTMSILVVVIGVIAYFLYAGFPWKTN